MLSIDNNTDIAVAIPQQPTSLIIIEYLLETWPNNKYGEGE